MVEATRSSGALEEAGSDPGLERGFAAVDQRVNLEIEELTALQLRVAQAASEAMGLVNRLRSVSRRLDALRVMRQCSRDRIDYITGEPV